MVLLAVHATPRAGRNEVAGWRGSELRVRVTSPPDGGKANEAICSTIAEALGVPKGAVSINRGHASRHKSVEIKGMTAEEVAERLGEPPESLW